MKAALRRKLFVIVIILIVVSATIYGFMPKAVDVDLVDVSRAPLQVTIEEEGRTRLKERYVVSAPTAGYMRRIDVKVGDSIRKGSSYHWIPRRSAIRRRRSFLLKAMTPEYQALFARYQRKRGREARPSPR